MFQSITISCAYECQEKGEARKVGWGLGGGGGRRSDGEGLRQCKRCELQPASASLTLKTDGRSPLELHTDHRKPATHIQHCYWQGALGESHRHTGRVFSVCGGVGGVGVGE